MTVAIKALDIITAIEHPRETMLHIESLLRETRPANVMAIGIELGQMTQTETVAMMLAMARAHYRVLTATPTIRTEPVDEAPAQPIERIRYECPACARIFVGGDMAPVGTRESKLCGACAARKATPVLGVEAKPGATNPAPEVTTVTGWDGEILDGTYTVELEDGTYRTLKVKTQADDANFRPGARLISYLNGPDNWRNYQGFGEVEPGNRLRVWRKHEGASTIIKCALALLAGPEAMVNGLKAYGRASGSCGMCGKRLTTPTSLKLGIGPICAERVGAA